MARELVSTLENKRKNYLINGGFDFYQRGTSISSSGNVYTADRWRVDNTQTNTHSRQSVGAPVGTPNYHRVQFGLNGAMQMFQAIESTNLRDLKGKTCTFSFLMRRDSNFTGNMEIRIQKNSTADTSIGGTWNIFETLVVTNANIPLRVPSATDWGRFSVTFTIPNDGTAEGFRVNFTTLSLQPSGATLEIAQPMLNLGFVAAPFSLFGEDYQNELAACQRYYEKSYDVNTAPLTVADDGSLRFNLASVSPSWNQPVIYKRNKRVQPTFRAYTPLGVDDRVRDESAATDRTYTVQKNGQSSASIQVNGGTTGNIASFHWTADAEL